MIVIGGKIIEKLNLPTDLPPELAYEPPPPTINSDKKLAPDRAEKQQELIIRGRVKHQLYQTHAQILGELTSLKKLDVWPSELSSESTIQHYETVLQTFDSLKEHVVNDNTEFSRDDIVQQCHEALNSTETFRQAFEPSPARAWIMLVMVLCCVGYFMWLLLAS